MSLFTRKKVQNDKSQLNKDAESYAKLEIERMTNSEYDKRYKANTQKTYDDTDKSLLMRFGKTITVNEFRNDEMTKEFFKKKIFQDKINEYKEKMKEVKAKNNLYNKQLNAAAKTRKKQLNNALKRRENATRVIPENKPSNKTGDIEARKILAMSKEEKIEYLGTIEGKNKAMTNKSKSQQEHIRIEKQKIRDRLDAEEEDDIKTKIITLGTRLGILEYNEQLKEKIPENKEKSKMENIRKMIDYVKLQLTVLTNDKKLLQLEKIKRDIEKREKPIEEALNQLLLANYDQTHPKIPNTEVASAPAPDPPAPDSVTSNVAPTLSSSFDSVTSNVAPSLSSSPAPPASAPASTLKKDSADKCQKVFTKIVDIIDNMDLSKGNAVFKKAFEDIAAAVKISKDSSIDKCQKVFTKIADIIDNMDLSKGNAVFKKAFEDIAAAMKS
jgi:hypothetical protein